MAAPPFRRLAAGLMFLACAASPAAAELVGRASVIDGDTIELQGQRIRLHGIDAPEAAQQCRGDDGRPYPCGRIAAHALATTLANARPTRCEVRDRDQYDRIVATCFRADGKDAAAIMVQAGHALDWPRYSGGAYAGDQKLAEGTGLGMWQGTFTPPWEWRQGQRAEALGTPPRAATTASSATTTRSASADCRIKGNINDRGDRIYHVPGSRWYSRTQISPGKGERWFCSADEARKAGWRAPRG